MLSDTESKISELKGEPTNGSDPSPEESEAGKDENEEQYFLSGVKLYVLILALGLAVFLMALDISVMATAIPYITERFHSTEDIGWYGSAYLLTLCSLQPLGGKIYASFSLKWTFVTFVGLFVVGSAVCGSAVSSNMLIIGRAVAGSGSAGIMSGTLSIVAVVVPLRQRPAYIGMLTSLFGVATISGPLIGGALTEHASWRWVFFINLPLGVVTIFTLFTVFRPPVRSVENKPVQQRLKQLDLYGAALFIPAVVMILLALQWGGSRYEWRSATIIGLFVGFGVLIIIFIGWQLRLWENAMIPPPIASQRTVLFSSITVFFGMGASNIAVLWLPEWFQVIKGASPTHSGVMNLPALLSQVLSSVVAGVLVTRLGYYNPWILTGAGLMAIATGLYSTFETTTNHNRWISYQVIMGLGVGMFVTMPLVAVQAVLNASQTPLGISIVTFFQFFGPALFVAFSQTIFNDKLTSILTKKIPEINIDVLLEAGTAGVKKVVGPEQLPVVIESYNTAITSLFYLATASASVAFFAAWGLEWKSVKGKNMLVKDDV